ncbi:adenosylcobinamide amidohydrolase [Paenibacillus donghaensis]|uniref:adenosylcobinamide amidohydrolase n=1 Tax=Paenibacillus donghaensis TaxID=414771 RepID=UPI0018841511|nr:adenosylcobinamide amidohydrolase [Paenibacillus donghaensis]MBE9917082.1 adenosylcobinamide amidohydrolase [Paenibacillus donghaensis]
MSTPFLDGNKTEYASEVWPGLVLKKGDRHLLLQLPTMIETMGSAVHGGGMTRLRRIANIYVDRFYDCSDPVRDVIDWLREWRYPIDTTAGLLTAVQLQHASVQEEKNEEAAVFCCVTAGTSNAARAGSERTTFPSYRPGTVNIMLMIDAKLSQAAMVNAVMTAVEAKAAALADLDVRDAENGLVATGTTSDAIILGVSQSAASPVELVYSGTATHLGGMIGRTVYGAVKEALQTAWAERK